MVVVGETRLQKVHQKVINIYTGAPETRIEQIIKLTTKHKHLIALVGVR